MTRIAPIDHAAAEGRAKELLDGVKASLGAVPNMFRTLAHSPAALDAYLQLSGALGRGAIPGALKESIALALAGENRCEYCAAAHTLIGGKQGLSRDEAAANLAGRSSDPRTAAAVRFALAVSRTRGRVDDAELAAVRAAGFGDGEIAEIVGHVALNTLTNAFNNVSRPDVDFPRVELPAAA